MSAQSVVHFIVGHAEWFVLGTLLLFVFAIQSTRRLKQEAKAASTLKKTIATNTQEPLTLHPEIDPNLCSGCGGCTRACPEGDILQLIGSRAVLVAPSKCVGHGMCEAACPMGAIKLVFGTKTKGMEIPRLSTNYETNVPGLYIAGELGGMGLIRNAVKQGTLAAKHAIENLRSVSGAEFDILIVGAGPAGLAASLTAIQHKKRYLCIDQNSFGGTVFNFPRQKIVMTRPAALPLVGTMKFSADKVSKEELLEYWSSIRKQTDLKVLEKCTFLDAKWAPAGYFEVTTSKGVFKAAKVILALGVRGAPRKLGLANEDLAKVTYSLIDADQYQGKAIAVVGGGNAGVEAAQQLAHPKLKNAVTLLVRGKAFDRCNEENQAKIFAMQAQGQVDIKFESSVTAIESETIGILEAGAAKQIKNDFLFVFAGADVPFKFLASLGVQIDKKFGEGLNKDAA